MGAVSTQAQGLPQRGDVLLLPRPVQEAVSPTSNAASSPSTGPPRERGRISMLEEQVRLIAEHVGRPLQKSTVNDSELSQSSLEEHSRPVTNPPQIIDMYRLQANPESVASSQWSPASRTQEPPCC